MLISQQASPVPGSGPHQPISANHRCSGFTLAYYTSAFLLNKYIDNYKCGIYTVTPTRRTGAVWLFGAHSDADPEPAR